MIQGVLSDLIDELKDLKDTITNVQSNIVALTTFGVKQAFFGKKDPSPADCYIQAYGAIKYTIEDRQEWEKRMQEKADLNGTTFDPSQYSTKDMMTAQQAAQANKSNADKLKGALTGGFSKLAGGGGLGGFGKFGGGMKNSKSEIEPQTEQLLPPGFAKSATMMDANQMQQFT